MKGLSDEKYTTPVPRAFEKMSPNEIGKYGEKKLKKVTGCVLTPRSGAGSMKGDGLLGFEKMIEKKSTRGKTMTVRREDIEKLMNEAWKANREPIFVIEFEAIKYGSQQWGLIPLERLMELYEIEEKYNGS